jgi:large subunit ribosomal protein L6
MSRIGKQPVQLPKGVKGRLDGSIFWIEGPKGKLSQNIPHGISVAVEADKVVVKRVTDDKAAKSKHGAIRAHIKNMVIGVVDGYKKEMDIVGVGYKAQMKGKDLILNAGFSHPVEISVSADLKVSVPKPTHIVIEGLDKQKVGAFSSSLRQIAPPEPYKGKGIRFTGEEVRKKLGKALAK